MLFDYLVIVIAWKAKRLVSCEYDAFSKNFNFWKFGNFSQIFCFLTTCFVSINIEGIWKSFKDMTAAKYCSQNVSIFSEEILGEHFTTVRAPLRAETAPPFWNLHLYEVTKIARSARGSARAVMKCFQMDSPDNLDAFWLLDH